MSAPAPAPAPAKPRWLRFAESRWWTAACWTFAIANICYCVLSLLRHFAPWISAFSGFTGGCVLMSTLDDRSTRTYRKICDGYSAMLRSCFAMMDDYRSRLGYDTVHDHGRDRSSSSREGRSS